MLGNMRFQIVIDDWKLLPASCINYSTINTFKKHLSSELESEAVKFSLSVVIVGIIQRKLASFVKACWRR